MNSMTRWAAPALIAALLAACASPSPAPVLLTLPPVLSAASAASAPVPSGATPIVAVRRIGIPEYLVARRVRYRADASTLAEWPNTYWAERIEIGVSREFVSALRAQLPGWGFCDTNCGDQTPTLSLQVDIVPMDYLRSAQKLQARARITIVDNGAPPKVQRSVELPYEIAASADTSQAQAQAIAELIRQVAAATAPLVTSARP
jgi:uncharacterized lipoprotein YmbA